MKERHKPKKPQNNYGDGKCHNYDTTWDGKEFCHDEAQTMWAEFIKWVQTDSEGKLKCKGNSHHCNRLKRAWLESQRTE